MQFSVPSLVLSTYANGGFDESIWDAAERGWIRPLQWQLIEDFAMMNMSLSCPTERKPLSYLRRKRAFANISLITLPLSQADETPLKTRQKSLAE
ncbi:hypothetical protein DW964_09080 [Ruminococcus sp. AM47-2BH]|nr:hypothetical protein DW964_09080 [Ruminococcus sp. AM47-2BH]